MFGYMGKILEVDLSRWSICRRELTEELAGKYMGGSGLGARLLYDMTDGGTAPLGEENVLIFMTGPFTGTRIPTSGRHAVVTRSPLTGIWTEADVGGSWGFQFKKTGYDGLIIKGKAEKPVYLWITADTVEIRDACHLWGKDTYELDHLLKAETDEKAVIQCIGPGGENLVSFASIMTDGINARAAGRGGVGAVMGSKKLKAVVVLGSREVKVKDSKKLAHIIKSLAPEMVVRTAGLSRYGTSGGIEGYEEMMNFPLKNWAQTRWPEGASKINGIKMDEKMVTGDYRCKTCIIGCGREVEITEGPYSGVRGAGPEYETFGTLGGLCLIDDLEGIAQANELCNRCGLDTISTGGVIAFGMEAFERGILTTAETGGVELKFGSADALLAVINKIAYQEGYIGRLLAGGVRSAAAELGKNSEEFAIHVKGMELPAHDPRAFFGLALSYATSNRGACHLQGFTHGFEKENGLIMPGLGINEPHQRHQVEGKAEFTARLQNLMCIFDSIKICKFAIIGGIGIEELIDLYGAVTGIELTADELLLIGERLYNLKRMYNIICGISRKDDTLPPRILVKKRGPGLPPIGRLLSDYYEYRDWDEMGIPKAAKLAELGLA